MTDRDIMQQAMEALQAVKEAPSKDEIQRAWIVCNLLQKRLAQQETVIDKSAAIRIATALGWVPAGDTSPERVDEAGKQRQEHLPSVLEVAVKSEREACAKLCEARYMGDNTREDMEARRCAAAIRARGQA